MENMGIFEECFGDFHGIFEMIRESGIGSREHVWLKSLFLGV